MSNNIEQNGRQLSTEQAAPPTDPRTRGVRAVPPPPPEYQRICRDFVWGICSMDKHCKYRHELEYESMRSILKFCHDFQNRTGCIRPECTYLHASREEENLFLTSGVIPRVLIERYSSISTPSETAPEPLAPMMYMNDYIAQPPPPPPPSAQISQPAPAPLPASMGPQMMPHMTGSMHPSMTQMPACNMMPAPVTAARQTEQPSHSQMPLTVKTNLHAVMPSMSASVAAPIPTPMTSILAPPPPPPPPPPPTLATASTQMTSPVYTGGQPGGLQHSGPPLYSLSAPQLQQPMQQPQQPTQAPFRLPVLFDPSKPPPPIASKRSSPADAEAGPSKALKLDEDIDSLCDSCIEQNLRTAIEQQEIEKLQREEEYRRRIYEQKTEEFENGKVLLRSLLSPNVSRVFDEFVDGNNATDGMFASSSSPTYNSSSPATVPKQFIFQLMEFLLNKRNEEQHTSPLELLTRRSTSQTELMFASILELFQNGVTSDTRSSSVFDSITNNGLSRLTNPLERSPPPPSRYPTAAPPRYPAPVPYVPSNNEVVPPAAPYRPEPVASYRPEPPASYRPEPAASYRPEPAASYRPEPAASYRPEPAASYRPEPGTSYRPEPVAPYRPEPPASYRPELATSYRPEQAAPYRPELAAPYRQEPVPPPQPMYVPYQATPGPVGAPAAALPPRPYYHQYPGPMPYAGAGGPPGPAPPAPSQPYQYMARMPQHYYPPFQ